VADIVRAANAHPGATLIADGRLGPAALLALAVAPVDHAIVDVAGFDNSGDDAFLERLYIPGIRRAGDLQTAVSMATGEVVIHNAGSRFVLSGPRVEARQLTVAEVVKLAGGSR
jgi:hypothetical protein